jgi:hypothetical protein
MNQAKKVREYLKENPELLNDNFGLTAQRLGVHYDSVRKVARQLREELKLSKPSTSRVPDMALEGTLTKAKTWQLPNGEWRESLTFQVDKDKDWDKFKEEFLADIKKLGCSSLPVPAKPKKSDAGICLEISLPDLHYGKGDITTLTNNFIHSVSELLRKAELSNTNIERILLPIGNDGLNSEGKRYTTTGGTPMNDSVDWRESFREYWVALASIITVLQQKCPVDILVIPGNHDMERMFYIGDCINAYFFYNDRVTINNSGDHRLYYEYGVNMILFTHGDKEKLADLPLIMATEQPEMFARTKCREVHMGHFHKEKVNEFRGIKTRFLPSICTMDEWHKMMGYKAQRSAQAFLWNKHNGLEGYLQINILD